jgi:hypothetical protein
VPIPEGCLLLGLPNQPAGSEDVIEEIIFEMINYVYIID